MSLAASWIPETEVETEAESKPVLTAMEIIQKSQPWQYAGYGDVREWKHREKEMWKLARKLASFSRSGDCQSDIFPSVRRVAEELGWPESKVYRVYGWLVAAGIASLGGQNASGCRYRVLHPEALRQTPIAHENRRHRTGLENRRPRGSKTGDIGNRLEGRENGSLNRREFGRLVKKEESVRELQNQIQIQRQITRPENRRVSRAEFRKHLLTFDYLETWVDDWLTEADRQAKAKGQQPDYEAAWDRQLQLDAIESIGHEQLSAVYWMLLNYGEGKEFTTDDVQNACGWDESYSCYHFQRALDLLVADKALRNNGSEYWISA